MRLLLKCALIFIWVVPLLSGCAHFHQENHDHVYVSARQVYLHDRVAAVSNRVALVVNGQPLEVIERGKRFLKVRTAKSEIGWLEEHAIIDDKLYTQFQQLNKKHAQDPIVATAQLRDDLYLHVVPGREAPHFLLVQGNSRVHLLVRGTVAKAQGPAFLQGPKSSNPPALSVKPGPSTGQASAKSPMTSTATHPVPSATPVTPPPVPMEDWWLVRDSQGNTGWLLAGRLDVEVPDEVGAYAEGQRMVGAYPIAKVMDDGTVPKRHTDAKDGRKGKGKTPLKAPVADETDESVKPVSKEITEYVTLLTPPHNGLPFDFDQIRVFTWSLNHHRYETAYRLHGIQGYLPLKISEETANGQTSPVFSFQIATGANVSIDPDTGQTHPVDPRTISFRLDGNMVKRTGNDLGPIQLTHSAENAAKTKKQAKKKR